MIYLDFETRPIVDHRPPKPVGMAVRINGASHYYAWGHPTNNNCTYAEACSVLQSFWAKKSICFHNAKFDYGVAVTHMGMNPYVHPQLLHDTLALAALHPDSAYRPSLGLKQLGESELNIPAVPQQQLHDWIEKNLGVKKNHGAHIGDAPGDLVGTYAREDVDLTALLYDRFKGYATTTAYKRYQEVMPVIYGMEQRGVQVDGTGLLLFAEDAEAEKVKVQELARELIGAGPVNLSSPAQLLKALREAGKVDEARLLKTPKGGLSSSFESLKLAITDSTLLAYLEKYKHYDKLVSGFVRPWADRLSQTTSLHAQYRYLGATRTGRMSSARPNLQQVPPDMRQFLLPPEGCQWLSCDYGQQELRILAHLSDDRHLRAIFEKGGDLHQQVADLVGITRRQAKTVNFGIIYGAGANRIAGELGITSREARDLLDRYFKRFYGVKHWLDEVRSDADKGRVFTTIGGRKVHAETVYNLDFDGEKEFLGYKMPNVIIQGSGADMMLQALINIGQLKDVQILTVVHDEANTSISDERQIEQVRDAMLSASSLTVPMTVDAKVGRNWAEAK